MKVNKYCHANEPGESDVQCDLLLPLWVGKLCEQVGFELRPHAVAITRGSAHDRGRGHVPVLFPDARVRSHRSRRGPVLGSGLLRGRPSSN